MPRAVFPDPTPPAAGRRALPYMDQATILEQSGAVVALDVPCSVWPATNQRADTTGEVFDHRGEIPARFAADVIERANLWLDVEGGARYRIVGAVQHSFVPHIALELRRVKSGG